MGFTIALLIVFFAVMIGVGVACARHAADVDGFVLGGRKAGAWLTAFAFGTSYFSAVIFVGYAGQFGWNFGLASTWIGLGNAFLGSLLAWVVLGRRTRIMTQHLQSRTMPDFFAKRFDSEALRIVASVIVFVFLIPYTASLYNGLSSLFAIAFDVPYWACILVMAALTAVYVVFGGYMATAVNDFIQGLVMLGGIVAVVAAVLLDNGGFTRAIEALSKVDAGTGVEGAFVSFFGADPLALLFVIILTSLGTWGLPQMVGKFYSIKSEEAIVKGTVISTVFAVIVAGGCYFLGGFGRLYAPRVTDAAGVVNYDAIVPTMLSGLSPVIIGVAIVLVLAASMSTLSSLVLTSSSTLTLDVIVPLAKKDMPQKAQLLAMRAFIIFFIVVSAAIAIVKDAYGFTFIAQMMGVSWGALAGAFLAPFLYGLISRRVTRAAVWVNFAFGCGVMLFQLWVSMTGVQFSNPMMAYLFASSIRSGCVAMLGGLILTPLVSLVTPHAPAARTAQIFSCYDDVVTTTIKNDLGA